MADLTVEPDTGSSHDPLLRVHQEARGGAVVVRVVGDVDLATAPALDAHLCRAQEQLTPPTPLVLDLTGVEFLASAGLSELIKHSQRCATIGSRLIVVAAHRPVLRAMEVTGLTDTIAVVASVDDALTIAAAD
ncbi:STAS domain-containing protein [Actinophytocola sp.]|uniref:STAS domain-containing protein n=1 Tax=Actinophytocola sp. TaxID=1872138 RepID=UPI00389AD033